MNAIFFNNYVYLFGQWWRSDHHEDDDVRRRRRMKMRRLKMRVNHSQLLYLSREETSGNFQKEGTLLVGRQKRGQTNSILFCLFWFHVFIVQSCFLLFSYIMFTFLLSSLIPHSVQVPCSTAPQQSSRSISIPWLTLTLVPGMSVWLTLDLYPGC